jgi:hypothetical protein
MDGLGALDRLHVDDDGTFDQEVDPKAAIENLSAVRVLRFSTRGLPLPVEARLRLCGEGLAVRDEFLD